MDSGELIHHDALIFHETDVYEGKIVDLNDAVVFEDPEGKHLLRMENVVLITSQPRDITEEKIGKVMKKAKLKRVGIYILSSVLGFSLGMFLGWYR